MSIPVALDRRGHLPFHRRCVPFLAVCAARILARLSPIRLRNLLELVRRGATPASTAQALLSRDEVTAVSLRCAGQACLQRSIAVALLCRARGCWPTWCTGVRTSPFAAHAWVEADGQPVGETYPPDHYRTLISIPPAGENPRA
ncbi:lasso peptide biosynthesis B2 protein [Streptomyces microflavus]|uniref:lasso peptide biosynthesis B2 protein n=1 Tax=Streptomyces microflavus TaxID=1919 RepID=UPI0033CD9AC9